MLALTIAAYAAGAEGVVTQRAAAPALGPEAQSGSEAAPRAGFGRIEFPTSGSREAQPDFLQGVAALHNFEYDQAVEAFRRARRVDAAFVMAYWGEALAHNSTLASSTDLAGARAVLRQLAPTREARLARTRSPKEQGFLEAVEILFGDGDEPARRHGYIAAMERLHARFPTDNEVASFYALALIDAAIRATYGLGAAPSEGHQHVALHPTTQNTRGGGPGLPGSDTQARAGRILQDVLTRNPEHPGAAHYLLHNYDDPEHAAQALDVARTYARIAPASSHARHMPAHIFVQLGLWREAAAADEAASNAADAWAHRMGVDEARRDYHPLTWLHYERLQLGQFTGARELLDRMQNTATRSGAALLRNHAASMRARYVVETRRWELLRDGDDFGNLDELVAIGISAARTGNAGRAGEVGEVLANLAAAQPPGSLIAPAVTVMERQIAGLVHAAAGRNQEAVDALREAAEAERRLPAGMGPPRPIKPAEELFGEVLLEIGRSGEARAAFERALQRYPNRSASVLGLARAAAATGDRTLAARYYDAFLANWSMADRGLTELDEARDALHPAFPFRRTGKMLTAVGVLTLAAGAIVAVRRRNRKRARGASAPRTGRRAMPSRTRGGRSRGSRGGTARA